MFLTAFSQLVSRICHPHPDVFRHLKTIIVYMLLVYPQQSLWMLMPVYKVCVVATAGLGKLQTVTSGRRNGKKNYSTKIIIIHSHWLQFAYSVYFIHSIVMCRMRRFLVVVRSFFHSCLLCTFSCHTAPPTILPSSLTPSCHLFRGLPLNLVVSKFISNIFGGILFSSILCPCPNQHNLFNLIVSCSGFFNHYINFFIG